MEYVVLVTAVALLQFIYFGVMVGQARARCGVAAPATSGHPEFERIYRVQMNTLEQLAVFLPAMWLFASNVSANWAAGLGALFIIGRTLYARSYVRDPKSRSAGFGLGMLPVLVMLLGVVGWAVHSLVFKLA